MHTNCWGLKCARLPLHAPWGVNAWASLFLYSFIWRTSDIENIVQKCFFGCDCSNGVMQLSYCQTLVETMRYLLNRCKMQFFTPLCRELYESDEFWNLNNVGATFVVALFLHHGWDWDRGRNVGFLQILKNYFNGGMKNCFPPCFSFFQSLIQLNNKYWDRML